MKFQDDISNMNTHTHTYGQAEPLFQSWGHKKKIQLMFVEYGFNFTREMKNIYISFVASPLMKCKYFALHSMKRKPYSTKNI